MGQQVNIFSELKLKNGSEVKAKLKEIEKLNKLDPKSSELIMNKLQLV